MARYPQRPSGVQVNGANNRGWGSGWPRCQSDKIVTIRLRSGLRLGTRREIAELVRLLLDECERRGYDLKPEQTGGFNCRPIGGTNRPSNHSWGLAVDLNWRRNPMQKTLKTDIPPWMVQLMWAYGFFWGGWYNGIKDPMHFEFVRTPAQAATLTARLKKALATEYDAPVRMAHYRAAGRPGLFGDDMFNPFLVQVQGDRRIFIVTSGGVFHVKNPTHLKYLQEGGVSATIKKIAKAELDELLEVETSF
ncbi:M15 family metallopeptidase [Actinomycetes bacterium KLBMP 9797]